MARKARQGSRPKKKQTRTRVPPVAHPAPPEPVVERVPAATPERVPDVFPKEQGPRVTVTRAARPYQHRRGRQVATVRSPVSASTYVLPREREYAFIRSDLRRLLTTAAVLAVLMVALLVILEP